MAITSIEIDREALDELKRARSIKTDREAVNQAIQRDLARARQAAALERIAGRVFSEEDLSPTPVAYPL